MTFTPTLAAASTPKPSPKPEPNSATEAFKLPSAKACVSRRKFSIRIRRLPGITFVRAVVIVNGKRVKTVKRSRITAPVNLVGLPKGRFTVSITATTNDGHTVTGKRRYHMCSQAPRLGAAALTARPDSGRARSQRPRLDSNQRPAD
jgi:hypothetical protein